MELKETIEMMTSEDYKERFIAEYCQLKIRYQKLIGMLNAWDNNELTFEPTCPRDMYDRQIEGMETYLSVLCDRAEAEGVELPIF